MNTTYAGIGSALLLTCLVTPALPVGSGLSTLQNGTVADANVVNQNFQFVDGKATDAQATAANAQTVADDAQATADATQATLDGYAGVMSVTPSGLRIDELDSVVGDLTVTNGSVLASELKSPGSTQPQVVLHSNGSVGIGTSSPTEALHVVGTVRTEVLMITGGADIVEGFQTSGDAELLPGTVVAIDPEHPGALMPSCTAYDAKVAGVVSGANGVNPGIRLGQESVLEGDTQVAMTGRVYVRCSTENGPIVPGDRLTTAATTGHAMKATDRALSDGAVLGKAMSSLTDPTGLVLVLVNLQ